MWAQLVSSGAPSLAQGELQPWLRAGGTQEGGDGQNSCAIRAHCLWDNRKGQKSCRCDSPASCWPALKAAVQPPLCSTGSQCILPRAQRSWYRMCTSSWLPPAPAPRARKWFVSVTYKTAFHCGMRPQMHQCPRSSKGELMRKIPGHKSHNQSSDPDL